MADRLLVLDRLMSGRHWTIGGAFEKARREAREIFNLIKRASHKFGAHTRGRVAYWDEIAETAQFAEFAQRLRSEVLANSVLSAAIEEFVDRRVKRFGLGSAPDRERDYEREYLLSEVCMSLLHRGAGIFDGSLGMPAGTRCPRSAEIALQRPCGPGRTGNSASSRARPQFPLR